MDRPRPGFRRPGTSAGAAIALAMAGGLVGPWPPCGSASAQVPPPPLPPATTGELARRTLAAGQAMERSGLELSRQQGDQNRQRACSVFYLAQVAYARAVELGIDSAEAEIDRLETVKLSLGCGPGGGVGP